MGSIRFIPTPVGNTRQGPKPFAPHSVHPHARGEHECLTGGSVVAIGSSPRPWGTPTTQAANSVLVRFIPTPVGNTLPSWPHARTSTVHPHARGEHA